MKDLLHNWQQRLTAQGELFQSQATQVMNTDLKLITMTDNILKLRDDARRTQEQHRKIDDSSKKSCRRYG